MKYAFATLVIVVGVTTAQNIVGPWGVCKSSCSSFGCVCWTLTSVNVGGGLGYTGPWECEPGFTCAPASYPFYTAFPNFLCTPDPGTAAPPYVYYVPQYGQCKQYLITVLNLKIVMAILNQQEGGGIGYTGPTVCLPPYICTVNNAYFHNCEIDPNNPPPPAVPVPQSPTPNLADPGSYCMTPSLPHYSWGVNLWF
jgi:hypothetical protein